MTWHRKYRYCAQCGDEIQHTPDSFQKTCNACDAAFFPSLSPAILVLIKKGSDILLARGPTFKPGMYSALAGFIDIGETAEMTVHREVQEEVGLTVKNLSYFGSQSWPFPSSFMMAFTAEYSGGSINIDANEIEDAQWFNIHDLPDMPPTHSISRQLIEHVISSERYQQTL